jgi:epoxyqueuosine reductase QueG
MCTTTIEDFTAAHQFNALQAAEANVQTHVSVCEICGEIWQWTKFSSTNFGLPVSKIPPMLHTH